MQKILFTLLFLTLSLNAVTINIAVAANVSYAIEDLKKSFKQLYPDINVNVILGSSGKLAAQISHGAPYGLFMSANMLYPQKLYEAKIAITEARVYAKGALALFSTQERDYSLGILLLKRKNIHKIAIANPNTAPYGKAAFEAIHNAKVYKNIQKKLIYAESISQTLSYIMSAADIGLIAKSSLYNAKMSQYKQGIHWSQVDTKLYSPIEQGVVLLKKSKNIKAYKLFYKFLFTEQAEGIFKKYGYLIS